MIQAWWREYNMPVPSKGMYPSTSYVAEVNGEPVASACLFMTNAKAASFFENLVSNPSKKKERREAVPALFKYIESVAIAYGYTHLVIMSYREGLKKRYEDLGFEKTMDGITLLAKKIGE